MKLYQLPEGVTLPDEAPEAGAPSRVSALRATAGRHAPPILIVDSAGLPGRLVGCTRRGVPIALPFMAVTGTVIDRLRPTAVVFALFGIEVDATVVLARLDELNFRGRIFAISPPLPDPGMVERELREQHPNLRFRVIVMKEMGLSDSSFAGVRH